MTNLPETDYELIRAAVADLEKCEADPRYRVDMTEWHEPVLDSGCHVNLVGAFMAKTIGVTPHWSAGRMRIPARVRALAVYQHGMSPEWDGRWRGGLVTHHEDDPAAFKADMLRMADDMEAEANGGPPAFVEAF